MQRFVHEKNIEHFRKRLAETTNPDERKVLLKLLKDEEAQEVQAGDDEDKDNQGS